MQKKKDRIISNTEAIPKIPPNDFKAYIKLYVNHFRLT